MWMQIPDLFNCFALMLCIDVSKSKINSDLWQDSLYSLKEFVKLNGIVPIKTSKTSWGIFFKLSAQHSRAESQILSKLRKLFFWYYLLVQTIVVHFKSLVLHQLSSLRVDHNNRSIVMVMMLMMPEIALVSVLRFFDQRFLLNNLFDCFHISSNWLTRFFLFD